MFAYLFHRFNVELTLLHLYVLIHALKLWLADILARRSVMSLALPIVESLYSLNINALKIMIYTYLVSSLMDRVLLTFHGNWKVHTSVNSLQDPVRSLRYFKSHFLFYWKLYFLINAIIYKDQCYWIKLHSLYNSLFLVRKNFVV